MHQGSHRGLVGSDYFPQNTKKHSVVAQNGHLETDDGKLLGVDLDCNGFEDSPSFGTELVDSLHLLLFE